MRLAILPVLFAAVAVASTARAADEGTASDFRCMAVALVMSGNANPQIKNAGDMASLYYLGRLDARASGADFEAGLKQEMARLTPQVMQTEAQRCGQQLKARGLAVQSITQKLTAGAKAPAKGSRTPWLADGVARASLSRRVAQSAISRR